MTMIGGMRRSAAVLAVILCPLAACSSEPKKLACDSSVAQACATRSDCVLTWAQAQNDTSFCKGFPFPSSYAECGGYHVISAPLITDVGANYYYDAVTGMLVAILEVDGVGTRCAAGPAGGFTPPTCTLGSQSPPQCSSDGGVADGATD